MYQPSTYSFGHLQINYVTVGKDAYLLEVPESLCHSISQEYELQASKKVTSSISWYPIVIFIRINIKNLHPEFPFSPQTFLSYHYDTGI